MATLTKLILPISGYTDQYYTYQCVVTENSYNVANNTSNVTIAFSVKGPWSPSFYEWDTNYGIVVDGSVKKTGSGSPYISTSYVQLLTWTGDIAHSSDGSKSINVGVYLYHSGPANYLPRQYTSSSPLSMGSVTLTNIPRASSLSLSTTSLNVGDSITANIYRAASNFTHTVEFYINNTYYQKYSSVETSQSFTIPSSWYAAMPSTSSCTAYCSITTYNGNTQIGNKVTKTFTVNVPSRIVPFVGTITLDPVDINGRNILVQGKNKLNISVSGCMAGTGSGIKSYTFSGPGISITTTGTSVTSSNAISNAGTLTYTVTVTDNRGRTASKTATITCYAYTTPYIKPFSAFRCNSNGVQDANGSYAKCNYNLEYSSVNGTNNVTVKIMYKKNTDPTYSSVTSLTNSTAKSGNQLLNTIATSSTYTMYATIVDQYGGSSESNLETVFSASRALNITPDGTGIALGKMAENTNMLDVKWQIRTDEPEKTMQNLSYRGHNLITSPTDDTTTQWGTKKNLATTFYTTTGQINDQPSQYGFLLNLTNGDKEVHQLWATQSNGSLFHRGGNASGWWGGNSTSNWRELLDSSNYTKYVPKVDYIVEQGTSGVWYYRKWNSGFAECYGYHTVSGLNINTAWGSWYASPTITLPSFPFTFSGSPDVYISWESDYSAIVDGVGKRESTKAGQTYLYRPVAQTNINGRFAIYAHGKWK